METTRKQAWRKTFKKGLTRLMSAAGVLGLSLAVALFSATPAHAEIKVGVVLPLSGPLASLGNEVYRGFELAKDLVNESGGMNGQKIVFATADVPGSTEATSQTNRLIVNDGVKVIVGSYASSISFAASQVAERNHVIYLEQGAIGDEITKRGFKYLFRLIYPATEMGTAGAAYLTDVVFPRLKLPPNQARVAILHEDSDNGTLTGVGYKTWLEKKGVKVVDVTAYSYKTNDLSSVVQRYKELKPDAVVAVSYTPDAILFWRQAREAGFSPKVFIGNGAGHNMPDFAQALGDDVNGVFNCGTSTFFNPNGLKPEAAKLFNRFHTEYQKRYNRQPSAHSAMGFNAMWLLLTQVMPKAGGDNPEKLREAFLSMDMPTGSTMVGWGVKFDPKTGSNTRAFPMIDQWQQKEIRTIYPAAFGVTKNVVVPLPDWSKRGNIGK